MRQETSIKRAAFINIGSRYTAALLQLAYTVILARILTPDDFGIVAIAQVFVTFFALFSDMGLGSAIIQRQDLEKDDLSRLFGFSCILAVCLALLFLIAGLPISYIYGKEILFNICSVLSVSVLLSTLNTIPNALLMKQKRFLRVGVRQILSVLAASAIGLLFAFGGAGFWSIVAYSIFSSAFIFLWNYLPNPIKPCFPGMAVSIRKVFNYSAYLFGHNVVNYFSRNLDNLLVGYFFGTASLGNYNKAYQLMQYPQTYLTSVVTPVLHPMLAEQQDDVDYIYETYIKTVKILSLIGLFLGVFCVFSAEEIILLVYGEQWLSTIPCFRFLALSIWSQMVCGTSGAMFQLLNRTKEHFIRGIIVAMVIAIGVLVGIQIGTIEAVSAFVGAAFWIAFLLLCPFLIKRSFHKSIADYLKIFVPDLLIAIVLSAFLLLANTISYPNTVTSLLVKLFGSCIVYLTLLITFKQVKWLTLVLPNKVREKIPPWALK